MQRLSAPSPPLRTGMLLTPRLRLVRPVNDGRGTNIWVADHLALAARVEVTFAEAKGNGAVEVRTELEERALAFRLQAEVATTLNDPHVVQILEQGDAKGVPFVVTKLLEGKGLRQRLLHGPATLDEVQAVVQHVCNTLGKAHSLGVTHGRLRPDHLFSTEVGGEPFVEIAGFGAALQSGTPNAYASPEQLLAATGSDARSDLWALAVTVYELLTTTLPFEAPTPAGVTVAICNAQFAPPSHYRADLPPGMDGWFAAAFAKDPARRFRDAAEFARSFEQALTAQPHGAVASMPPLPDDSLEMDDGEEDEKTRVKWDMPEDVRAIERGPLDQGGATPVFGTPAAEFPAAEFPAAVLPATEFPATRPPAGGLGVMMPAPGAPVDLARVSTPGAASPSRVPQRPASFGTLPPTLPPTLLAPKLRPGVYLESPYIASVASALPAPSAPAGHGGTLASPSRLFGLDRSFFTPDKAWLAALAFAAGVGVTWFVYDPEPEGGPVIAGEADDGEIRTVSVDDLPRVDGDEPLPAIIQTSQLPRARDEDGEAEERLVAPVPPAPRRAAAPPVQKVQSLAPAAPRARAAASTAAASSSRPRTTEGSTNCNPPYYFDNQGIRRLKSECLNGTGVITGPYGAVLTTNVAAKAPSPAPSSARSKRTAEKQARAGASCSPPYYLDGKIRRLKLECL